MPITVLTGPPGAGKSYTAISDQMIAAYTKAKRRVLTNIEGVDPDAWLAFAIDEGFKVEDLGQVVTFHGEQMSQPDFWPTEAHEKAGTIAQCVVQPGDLVVVDEFPMYVPPGEKPPEELAKCWRYHRHMTFKGLPDDPRNGQAMDIVVMMQNISDLARPLRGLMQRSFDFMKMDAQGLDKRFTWKLYNGKSQAKGTEVRRGIGKYEPKFFCLYASSAGAKEGTHTELKTSKRNTIWGPRLIGLIALAVFLVGSGVYALSNTKFFATPETPETAISAAAGTPQNAPNLPPPGPPKSDYRVVGQIAGETGVSVMVQQADGATKLIGPANCSFEDYRVVSCLIDGREALAIERPSPSTGQTPLSGVTL